MISDFFTINPVLGPDHTQWWRVSWDERRGVVRKNSGIDQLCQIAFETGAWQIAFVNKEQVLTVDCIVYFENKGHLPDVLLGQLNGVAGVAFQDRSHADQFAENLEKVVSWKLLQMTSHE